VGVEELRREMRRGIGWMATRKGRLGEEGGKVKGGSGWRAEDRKEEEKWGTQGEGR